MDTVLANVDRIVFEVIAEVCAPPPRVDYHRWAVDHVVFSERESPFPGPYISDRFPYFTEILTALGPEDPCRIVTFVKSAQLGGTTIANIFALGSIHLDPGDFLYVHPTDENARRWSKMKLAPMLRSTPAVASLFPHRSRDGSDAILYKERIDGRGAIQISGANSPASLSQVTMRRQVQDDLSKCETNAAGDPESQADSRSRAHEFAKILKIGTPLLLPGCRTTRNFEAGSQERFHVPCPHCGHRHVLEWENMLAGLDESAPETAHFTCPSCGSMIGEHHRPAMLKAGSWIAEQPAAKSYHRSFAIWSAYSLLQSWATIAREWVKAKGDPSSEQVFINDTVGQAYRVEGEAPPWEELRARAEISAFLRGQVPPGAMILTMGLDCQKDRVEWQLVGWGRDHRRWVIDVGIVPGHIAGADTHKRLDDLIRSTWRNGMGFGLAVERVAIDGNAWTEDVWSWARQHPSALVMMVRGASSDQAPRLRQVKKERGLSGKLLKYSSRFYNFNTAIRKFALYAGLKRVDPTERGFIGLPAGLDPSFFQQLTAERRVPVRRRDGNVDYRWEKDPQQANEALDTHLQAEVAAEKLGVRYFTEAVWNRLEREREIPPLIPELQRGDFGVTGITQPRAHPGSEPSVARPPRQRRVLSRGVG